MKPLQLNKKQTAILNTLAPQLEKSGRSRIWILISIAFILFGAYGLYMQIVKGHGVTGMRDHAVWGYYIVNFIYFIGVSYAGAMLAAILYYFKIPWGRPIIRIAALMALITGIIGPVFILLCIGRFDRIHYLFVGARVQSPITWDVMVISTYLVGITLFIYLLLIKDFAILRDTKQINFPNWRRKLYRILAIGYQGNSKQIHKLQHSSKDIAVIMLPKVILAFSVLSWIFGMTLRPGWHSTIFGPSYIVSSIATGVALIICLMWAYRRIYRLEDHLKDMHFKYMGYILLSLITVFGYFTLSEYVTLWYSSGKWETALTDKLLSFGRFGWMFHFANFFGILFPFIIVGVKKFRTPNLIALVSAILVFTMWMRRFLNVVPPLETPLIPMQETRPEYMHYSATWVELSLVFAGVATFLLFFILISKVVNILPIAAYEDPEKF